MQNELIEYNKHCVSSMQVSFFFLGNLMFKCINDCCHLEVDLTVNSLQSFVYLKFRR